jgi:hypothetical protein
VPDAFVSPRAAALEQALVAAGAPGLLPTYDMLYGGHAHRLFQAAVMESGLTTIDSGSWPYDGHFVGGVRGELFREGSQAFYRLPDGTLALVKVCSGWAGATLAGASTASVQQSMSMFQTLYPATYLDATDDRVPVTFWMHGKYGPERRLRMIDASPWDTISRNYSAVVRDELDGVMRSFEPGKGGLLLLWQGPPGTGKTWALRALVSEWLPWAEFHYITDPDAFFVESASYMVEVLLSDSYEALSEPGGDVVSEAAPEGKWRVLILEDTGELLSAGAKEKYGQGLSRLLNVVDGLIGQGLRVLVLVTTNDELGELNAAVRRPGRCASQIVFSPMTDEEAAEWLGSEPATGTTLAELYADVGEGAAPLEPVDEPAEEEALTAAAATDVVSAIQAVASEHAPEGGYGETSWNAEAKAVFWNHADWTSNDEHDAAEAAFLAIDGVENFDCDSEANTPEGEGWEQVWPVPGSEEAYERVLALATRPLAIRPTALGFKAPRASLAERAFDAIDGALALARRA